MKKIAKASRSKHNFSWNGSIIYILNPSDTSLSASNSSFENSGSNSGTHHVQEDAVLLSASMTLLLAFICLFIAVANGLVIVLMYKTKILISPTNMFLTSLAFSDLIAGLLGFPIFVSV